MFPIPPSWSVMNTGTGLLLFPADQPRVGGIRYAERLGPLEPVRKLVAEFPKPVGFVPSQLGPIERFQTEEGEYAAYVVLSGHSGEVPTELSFAFVFGDDFYSRIVGAVRDPARFAQFRQAVRQIALSERLFLGQPRRRRYLFQPPPGWQGVNVGFEPSFLPPDYPNNPTSITVTPALPLQRSLQNSIGRNLLGLSEGDAPPAQLAREELPSGLRAEYWHRPTRQPAAGSSAAGPAIGIYVALMDDGVYMYSLRLIDGSAASGAGLALLKKLAASVEPLPQPQKSESLDEVAAFWAT